MRAVRAHPARISFMNGLPKSQLGWHSRGYLPHFDGRELAQFIRNARHFAKVVVYIENNPVKARLCEKAEDWPFSSALFRKE